MCVLFQKINSKNAFGLHLIDYMADMLHRGGDMTNFQVSVLMPIVVIYLVHSKLVNIVHYS